MVSFYLMAGIPGSGKSTAAAEIAGAQGATLISTDRLREELTGDAADRSQDRRVFPRAHARIGEALAQGLDVVYDATNLTRQERKRVLKLVPPGTRKVCCFVRVPLAEAIARNAARARVVPPEVIIEMAAKLQEPTPDEGWDEIRILEDGGGNSAIGCRD